GTACAIATLIVVFRACERGLGRRTAWAAVPAVVLACSAGFACWTSGGLETQLFTMLVAIAIDGVVAAEDELAQAAVVTNAVAPKPRRPMVRVAVALALAAMTRPEGLLIAAVTGAV